MNFSVTGEPAPSQLDQKRKQLMQSILGGGPGQQRLLAPGGGGGRGGFTRGFTASDSPSAAVPNLSFNPFLAQLQRGVGGLNQPTQGVRAGIDQARGAPPLGGMLQSDNTPANPPDAAMGMVAAPPDLSTLMSQGGAIGGDPNGAFMQLFGYDPTQPAPPPAPTPLPYLRPGAGRAQYA